MTPGSPLVDCCRQTMLDTYLRDGMREPAVFELFERRLPPQRNFLVAAGLEQVLDLLEQMSFGDAKIAWLDCQGGFSPQLLDDLRHWRFAGEVHAMPEGALFFADEPVLRCTAPLPQALFVESRLRRHRLRVVVTPEASAAAAVEEAQHQTLANLGHEAFQGHLFGCPEPMLAM